MPDGKFPILGFRRGGSSIFFSILQILFGDRLHDWVAEWHRGGVRLEDIPAADILAAFDRHSMVGMFRVAVPALWNIRDARPILIVRDPRDCALSWYYARAVHGITGPSGGPESLENYFANSDNFLRFATRLMEFAAARESLVVRYEDMVVDPGSIIRQVCAFTGHSPERGTVDLAMVEANFEHIVEEPESHNRSGQAHYALRTLPYEQLELLNDRYRSILAHYNYPLDASELRKLPPREEIDSLKRFALRLSAENHYRRVEVSEMQRSLDAMRGRLADLERKPKKAKRKKKR